MIQTQSHYVIDVRRPWNETMRLRGEMGNRKCPCTAFTRTWTNGLTEVFIGLKQLATDEGMNRKDSFFKSSDQIQRDIGFNSFLARLMSIIDHESSHVFDDSDSSDEQQEWIAYGFERAGMRARGDFGWTSVRCRCTSTKTSREEIEICPSELIGACLTNEMRKHIITCRCGAYLDILFEYVEPANRTEALSTTERMEKGDEA